MAKEYLPKDEVMAAFTHGFPEAYIEKIVPSDVRPVVRGRWVNGKCDNCGEHAPYWCLATTFHESNFCPNCGADMREVDDG